MATGTNVVMGFGVAADGARPGEAPSSRLIWGSVEPNHPPMNRLLFAVPWLLVGACASGSGLTGDAGPIPNGDADETFLDAPVDGRPDGPRVDAFGSDAGVPDAGVPDAFIPPDACVPVVSQLLVNPLYDQVPDGTGWAQTPIDAAFPLVTGDDGVPEQTAPLKVWLGGFQAPGATPVTDVLFQDVAIPALTSSLVLTGFFDVRTTEPASTTAFDTAALAVTTTSATPIVTILTASNLTPKTDWTPISFTFAQNLSGQTVRLRMTSSNDISDPTSFFFDSFALTATHGCP